MERTIYEITGVSIDALQGKPLSELSIDERFKWAEERETKREEDKIYCLLGIFGIYLPLLYERNQRDTR